MKTLRTLTLLSLVLGVSATALAGIRPSFLPEQCSWRATDIVVVTEGKEIDGILTILETLKGDLKAGATIRIPELAEFKAKNARAISSWWDEKSKASDRAFVTGAKMILFMRDATKLATNTDDDDDEYLKNRSKENKARWQPANIMGDELKYSTVWIEQDQVFYFIQQMNPGPSLLSKSGMTETQLKDEVADVSSVQDALKTVIAIPDGERKAESLQPFLQQRIYLAREKAFDELVKCDQAALPVLRRVLADGSLLAIHPDAIDALEAVGGKKIGPELTSVAERETEYWKQRATSLKVGWQNEWDTTNGESALLRNHWSAWSKALLSLRDIRYVGSQKVVTEVSQLMKSKPQVYDQEISQACDQILRSLLGKGELAPIPNYELHITGNKKFSTDILQATFAQSLSEYQHLQKPSASDMFDYALDRLGEFISSQGYTETGSATPASDSAGEPEVAVVSKIRSSDHEQATIGTNKRGVVILVRINEGTRYRLGAIRITGGRVFTAEQIREMLSLQSGDICDFVAIRKWQDILETEYRNRGYSQVQVEDETDLQPPANGADNGIANFKVSITEGLQFRVQSIKFAGKSEIPSPKLLGALKLAEGGLYSEEKLDASLAALNELGLDIEKDSDVETTEDEEHALVNIVIVLDKRTSRRSSGRGQLERRIRRIFN